jgi:hypothetical protein
MTEKGTERGKKMAALEKEHRCTTLHYSFRLRIISVDDSVYFSVYTGIKLGHYTNATYSVN